jgi:antitoxin VapB
VADAYVVIARRAAPWRSRATAGLSRRSCRGGERRWDIDEQKPSFALSIKDPETERLARELAKRTGETLTIATRRALAERLTRIGPCVRRPALREDLAASRRRWSMMRVLDSRNPDEIIGYNEHGLPADGDRHIGLTEV